MCFTEIVKIACDPPNPPRCAMAGQLWQYNFDHLLDFYNLKKGQLGAMKRFKGFRSFADCRRFAENTNDKDFINKLDLVDKYFDRIPEIVEKIKKRCCYDAKTADYVFTTTHKAKGLEWKTVILLDDFSKYLEIPGGIYSTSADNRSSLVINDDEKNLLYVAMTRAKTNLVLNFSLFHLLMTSGHNFEKITSMRLEKRNEHSIACINCKDNVIFDDNSLGLKSSEVKIDFKSDRDVIKSFVKKAPGLFCSVCASSSSLKHLRLKVKVPLRRQATSQNREFLRYFVGVLPDKYQDGLNKVLQGEPVMYQAHVVHGGGQHFMPLAGMMIFDDFDNIDWEEAVFDDDENEDDESSDEESNDEAVDEDVLHALEEDFEEESGAQEVLGEEVLRALAEDF